MDLTKRVQDKIDSKQITIVELADRLGITRPTIYARLKKDDWKKLEKRELLKIVN